MLDTTLLPKCLWKTWYWSWSKHASHWRSVQRYYDDSPSVCSAQPTAVCFLSLDVRTMGTQLFDGFNSGHDQRKKLISRKNISITICLASSPSGRVLVWSSPPRCKSTRIFSSAALSYKKFIQLHFKLGVTLFSTATFQFERPIATRKNSCVRTLSPGSWEFICKHWAIF